jgi:hypothetical protein
MDELEQNLIGDTNWDDDDTNWNDNDLEEIYYQVRSYYEQNNGTTISTSSANQMQTDNTNHPLFNPIRQLHFSSCRFYGDDSVCTCRKTEQTISISQLLSPVSLASTTKPSMSDIVSPISYESADSPCSVGSNGSNKPTYGPYDLDAVSMCQVVNPSSMNGWKSADDGQFKRIYLGMNSLDIIISDIMFYLKHKGGKSSIFDYISEVNRNNRSNKFVQLLTLPIDIQIVGQRNIIAYIHCYLESPTSLANENMDISITFDPIGLPKQDDQQSIRKHMRDYFMYSLSNNKEYSEYFCCNVDHTKRYVESMAKKISPSNELIQAILSTRKEITYFGYNILDYLWKFSEVSIGKSVFDIGFTDEIIGIQNIGPFHVITGTGICCYAPNWTTNATNDEPDQNLCESSFNLTSLLSD